MLHRKGAGRPSVSDEIAERVKESFTPQLLIPTLDGVLIDSLDSLTEQSLLSWNQRRVRHVARYQWRIQMLSPRVSNCQSASIKRWHEQFKGAGNMLHRKSVGRPSVSDEIAERVKESHSSIAHTDA
ncbi:hypothetical protein AVEN_226486-1 [Araneus ventricosus]|uniref:DUF4817 domain-containing protein n=1 Tax=Araneus ventricosus TaxID=182803 RepID=A0A4Y2E3A7_ARAVE|nr:hypothetical protein AVEN_226486-1 [Araneus ventricosus]